MPDQSTGSTLVSRPVSLRAPSRSNMSPWSQGWARLQAAGVLTDAVQCRCFAQDACWATRRAPRPRPGADPGAVSLIVDIDMTRTEVVEVMPPAFMFPGPGTALWRPLPIDRETTQLGNFFYRGAARLAVTP